MRNHCRRALRIIGPAITAPMSRASGIRHSRLTSYVSGCPMEMSLTQDKRVIQAEQSHTWSSLIWYHKSLVIFGSSVMYCTCQLVYNPPLSMSPRGVWSDRWWGGRKNLVAPSKDDTPRNEAANSDLWNQKQPPDPRKRSRPEYMLSTTPATARGRPAKQSTPAARKPKGRRSSWSILKYSAGQRTIFIGGRNGLGATHSCNDSDPTQKKKLGRQVKNCWVWHMQTPVFVHSGA